MKSATGSPNRVPEGFGLNLKSKRPLETLWKNKNIVDKINRKLEQGENLPRVSRLRRRGFWL